MKKPNSGIHMIRPNLKPSLNQCKCALQRTCRKALKYASTRKQRGKSENTRMSKALAQLHSYACGYSNTSDKTSNATPHKHNKKYTPLVLLSYMATCVLKLITTPLLAGTL